MRSRSLIIISCIFMLGMTVLQASAVPCCCKTRSGHACAKHASSSHVKDTKKACSHMAHSEATSNLTNQTGPEKRSLTTISHTCRCLHLSAIVALASGKAYDSSIRRLLSAALAVQSPVSYCQPVLQIETFPDLDSRNISIHIATCTLRC